MKKLFYALVLVAISTIANAQTETIDNKKVVDLTKAKLGDDVIINFIKTSPANFDCSVAGIIQLKKDSVSENVIAEIMKACNGSNPAAASNSAKNTALKQPDFYGPIDQQKIDAAMQDIRQDKDEFRKGTVYYSKKTPKYINDEDRLYACVYQTDSGKVFLDLMISHINHFGGLNMAIQEIIVKADDSTLDINAARYMVGNGTAHSFFTAPVLYKTKPYRILKQIITSNQTKVRFEGQAGQYLDFEVSGREKKALNEVIQLFEAMKGISTS